jgi:very-short-patch-repair endonuclease
LKRGTKGDFWSYWKMLSYNKNLKHYSRMLRKNMTNAEKLLWSKLKSRQLKGCQFNRQKPIGNYIVDFYSVNAKLVIEVDGGQHYTDKGKQDDNVRDNYMAQLGLRVLRFSDRDVLQNIDGVVETIMNHL